MSASPFAPCLVLLQHGRPTIPFPLTAGTATVGRDKACGVVIPDLSVSRRHAEIVVTDSTVEIRDLDSRNGTQVNAVPRKQARLQDGDRVRIGTVNLQFCAHGVPRPATAVPFADGGPEITMGLGAKVRLYETQRRALRLPDARPERHLAAFYHLCSWITDGVDQSEGLSKWLELLLESLRAHTVQYYAPAGGLQEAITREPEKPRVKFAAYLLERFRKLPEATAYAPRELDRFQQRLGNFRYLVAPLRRAAAGSDGACPVVVALRAAEWEPFSADDRVLLQSAVQLWLRSGLRAEEVRDLKKENQELRQRQAATQEMRLLGQSDAMRALRARIERIAATKATVLITGETGSGKEVVAHCLHHQSPRTKAPFIKLNCGAIPVGLIESELFGHARGAFTDAHSDHKGKFSLAHGGTLFLDEIGELPPAAQTKLLRVLESGDIEPLGAERPQKADVRVLAATNRSLADMVAAREFREDLYYRLNVFSVAVPPLRDHRDDIAELAQHFLQGFCRENGLAQLTLAPGALAALRAHTWPGNVRELRNVIQRVAVEADGTEVGAAAVRAVSAAG